MICHTCGWWEAGTSTDLSFFRRFWQLCAFHNSLGLQRQPLVHARGNYWRRCPQSNKCAFSNMTLVLRARLYSHGEKVWWTATEQFVFDAHRTNLLLVVSLPQSQLQPIYGVLEHLKLVVGAHCLLYMYICVSLFTLDYISARTVTIKCSMADFLSVHSWE